MMVCDQGILFEHLTTECGFGKISTVAGPRMKSKHTIGEQWPMRLKKNATQEEFNILLASSHIGSKRYMEWDVAEEFLASLASAG